MDNPDNSTTWEFPSDLVELQQNMSFRSRDIPDYVATEAFQGFLFQLQYQMSLRSRDSPASLPLHSIDSPGYVTTEQLLDFPNMLRNSSSPPYHTLQNSST